jgi:alginate O-acetyltransferase complex protein AlgI
MNFTSFQFALFFSIVFLFYWFAFDKSSRCQNLFLLVSSFCFYAWCDWRFLALLIICSFVPFMAAKYIENKTSPSFRKTVLLIALFVNLGILGYFKYYDFFIGSFVKAFSSMGMHLNYMPLKIILPLGISFYTFSTIGYLLDVYNKKTQAVSDPGTFFLFVGFFPHLLSGPIARSSALLPQLERKREFDYSMAVDGSRQIVWGLFKKIVIADSCAVYTERIFGNYESFPGSTLFVGMIYYGIQIYADFSGYSDMAIGMGKLLGIHLLKNFSYPYFSHNISEFWRRWHISLSLWFRDYLFLPVAYLVSRKIKRNTFLSIKAENWAYGIGIVFAWLLVGLWHGAGANFLVWGIFHGAFLLSYHLWKQKKPKLKFYKKSKLNRIYLAFSTILTFLVVQIGWVFFKSQTVGQALSYISRMLTTSLFVKPHAVGSYLLFMVIAFVLLEWLQRKREHVLQIEKIRWPVLRWGIYYFMMFAVLFFISREQNFIYLQF